MNTSSSPARFRRWPTTVGLVAIACLLCSTAQAQRPSIAAQQAQINALVAQIAAIPAGPPGPSGVIGSVSVPSQGYGGIANPLPATGTFVSLGSEATVTVPANAKVLVSSTAVLGSTAAGGASGLGLDVCYRPSAGALVGGGYFMMISQAQNTASAHALTRVVGPLAAGTYSFGLCYASTSANWNANDFVNNTLLIFN